MVVKDSAETTTYVLNTDYIISAAGIIVLSTGAITDGQTIHYSLSTGASNKIEALTNLGKDRVLIFEGLNTAQSCAKHNIKLHKVVLGPAGDFSWIGEDFSTLQINGSVLADTSITTAGLSQYFRIDMPSTV
ncbi:MAG TPA: hypothetical protein DIC36_00975 [Gammaproteobacteria bacterium]|nr:hypothetical protein [Gammaproteobacteria bacterium]